MAKQRVDVRVTAREGEPLVTEWRCGEIAIEARSAQALGGAHKRALDLALLRDQFSRLGNTPYELGELDATIEGAPFAPSSLLNQLRRDAVERLQSGAGCERRGTKSASSCCHDFGGIRRSARAGRVCICWCELRSNSMRQLTLRPETITLDYLDLYGLKPSLERIRAAGLRPRVASPRILKPGEERIAQFLVSCDCPIVVRGAGMIEALRSRELVGDFSLNAANALSASMLLEAGIGTITPTHDLNAAQVEELAREIGASRIEAIAYQHLPVFHTEHCVFCRFLSKGTSYKDCGRPCEKHSVELRDSSGRNHPVMADVGCRNTVFGAEAQQASAHLERWLAAGIRHFRLEFAHESGEQVERVTRAFAGAIASGDAGRLAAQLREVGAGGNYGRQLVRGVAVGGGGQRFGCGFGASRYRSLTVAALFGRLIGRAVGRSGGWAVRVIGRFGQPVGLGGLGRLVGLAGLKNGEMIVARRQALWDAAAGYSSSSLFPTFNTARKASCGISTLPTRFMRFLPSFCFSSSLRLREMSPP